MDATFHSDSKGCFKNDKEMFRGFLYSDYSVEPHDHDFYEINIILNGTGIHLISNESVSVRKGDVFVVPPSAVHAYRDTNKLDVYHILLHRNFISENADEAYSFPGFLQLMEIEPFLRQNFPSPKFLRLSPHQLMQIQSDIMLIDENTYPEKNFFPLKHHTMWKIIYKFSELLHTQNKNESKFVSNKYETEIIKVLEYIHRSYGDKITIASLCNKSFLSRSTFLRSFQSMCNMTPMEYVNKYRCEKAIEMMESKSLSKTEIAHRCGFYDLSHMMRNIK